MILLKTLVIIFSLVFSSCQNPSATDTGEKVQYVVSQTAQQTISITSPTDGSRVCQRTMVRGSVSDFELQVFVLIHPMATDIFWVQPVPNMRQDGRWDVYSYFGEPSQGIGKPFEIIAIASRNKKLFKEKDILLSPLSNNPQIIFRSNPVIVTRDHC